MHCPHRFTRSFEEPDHFLLWKVSAVDDVGIYRILQVSALVFKEYLMSSRRNSRDLPHFVQGQK
jgi:hypothetical protein